MRREGGDAALARHVIAEHGNGANDTGSVDAVDDSSKRARGGEALRADRHARRSTEVEHPVYARSGNAQGTVWSRFQLVDLLDERSASWEPVRWVAFNGVRVFSATMQRPRDELGEGVSQWLAANPAIRVVETVVLQPSGAGFHCLSITLLYDEELGE
jgi:hypothetical protein